MVKPWRASSVVRRGGSVAQGGPARRTLQCEIRGATKIAVPAGTGCANPRRECVGPGDGHCGARAAAANLPGMKSRWALGVLGAWLMGSLLMFMVAPTNFRLIDELLAHSSNASFHALVERDGPATARALLRYLASELNRTFFLRWNITQAALGAALIYLLPRPVRDRWSWGLALAATGIAL